MARSGSSGIALTLTTLSLLTFAFFSFMGMEYLFRGDHRWAIGICLTGLLLLGVFLYLACWGKTTRNKLKGRFFEALALIFAGVILFWGRTPFSQFFYVVEHEKEINALVIEAKQQAHDIDSLYAKYAHNRLTEYRLYDKRHAKDSQTATQLVTSIKRRLFPTAIDSIAAERSEWMSGLQTVNVWNIATAKNLNEMISASDEWTKQYATVSQVIYEGEGEGCEPFSLSDNDIQSRFDALTKPIAPSPLSNIVMVACYILILVYYFQSLRARSRYQGQRV